MKGFRVEGRVGDRATYKGDSNSPPNGFYKYKVTNDGETFEAPLDKLIQQFGKEVIVSAVLECDSRNPYTDKPTGIKFWLKILDMWVGNGVEYFGIQYYGYPIEFNGDITRERLILSGAIPYHENIDHLINKACVQFMCEKDAYACDVCDVSLTKDHFITSTDKDLCLTCAKDRPDFDDLLHYSTEQCCQKCFREPHQGDCPHLLWSEKTHEEKPESPKKKRPRTNDDGIQMLDIKHPFTVKKHKDDEIEVAKELPC